MCRTNQLRAGNALPETGKAAILSLTTDATAEHLEDDCGTFSG